MKTFIEFVKDKDPELSLYLEKNWLKGAVNPEHKGYCTPPSKETCTPKRKALADRFRSGDIHADNMKKKHKKHKKSKGEK
jgi:hypothetical protein